MANLTGKEILLIDDAEDMRFLAGKILANDGASVNEAGTVDDGLRMAKGLRPHLIFLDLNFSGSDGFDFLRSRRAEPELAGIPVIVLSAMKDKDTVMGAISLGANDYLLKPFRATQLLQKARKQLKVSSFLRYVLPENGAPAVTLSAPAEIVKYSEFGFRVESSVKFEKEEALSVESELLDSLPVENALLQATPGSVYVGPSRYATEVRYAGVGEAFLKKMKKAMGG